MLRCTSFGAITISGPIEGAVVVDLKGFSITNSNLSAESVGIKIQAPALTNGYPVTIRNGTVSFPFGLIDDFVSNVTVKNITFTEAGQAVTLNSVTNSTVNNCNFNATSSQSASGIIDNFSSGGNTYNKNNFANITQPLVIRAGNHLTLDLCQIASPILVSTPTAQAANPKNFQISALPFNINAPGTYVLTGDLTANSVTGQGVINISTALAGPVILDLKGFTIAVGQPPLTNGYGIVLGFSSPGVPNAYPITIQNGTILNAPIAIRTFSLGKTFSPI